MRLTVVGCSGSYPGPTSPASCYLLEAEHQGRTWRLLLDLGSGALGALHHYADPLDVDGIVLSHLHPDHCADLNGLYVIWKYHPDGARPPIPVWGPRGVAKHAARAYGLPRDPGMTQEFDFHEYDEEPIALGPFTVRAARVVHPGRAYALRVAADGATVTYSGDTAPCPALVELARGTDLLLAEAAFRDSEENPPDLHLTGSDAGRTAAQSGAGRLVVTHVAPWHDPRIAEEEARSAYDGPLDLAECGRTFRVEA